ncbi:MAG: M28 family peptidase [Candidatus Thorarchaeota archaeon]|jgi:hypothetical protein
MEIEQVIANVDVENLYSHVLKTEGVKHVLIDPEKLEACADYILDQFRKMGLKTNEHKFRLEGFDYEFRNIEAWLGDNNGSEVLVTSHYDTAYNAPGANDNGSAITVMLESARVLSEAEYSGNIRFISFNLEEGNPKLVLQYLELDRKHNIRDKDRRYTSWASVKTMKHFDSIWVPGLPMAESFGKAIDELQNHGVSGKVMDYLIDLKSVYEGITPLDFFGRVYCVGSYSWLREALKEGKSISGVINLETMGYVSKKPNSQSWPEGIEPEMFRSYNTQEDLTVGDFITIVGDRNSGLLANTFGEQSRRDDIELPYAIFQQDFSFEQAAHMMPDLLRSDHAAFWKKDIPALMLTDSANFRYPYYHTRADTIDKLDFDFLAKICKATIATVSDFAKER